MMPLTRVIRCCDADVAIEPFVNTMRAGGIPIEVVGVPTDRSGRYGRKLILVRTDQHVVWRGDAAPDRAETLIDILRGKARAAANQPRCPMIVGFGKPCRKAQ
jgi:hypothetical protein